MALADSGVVTRKGWGVPVVVALLCLMPLLLTPVLPSVDFYAHIVRYNVLAHPAANAAFYAPHWTLLPNLGMDILGTLILTVLPPLAGAKVLAALVILAPVLGTMRLSQALHGRISPFAALMAGVLAYNLILFWGFANFLLGFGIALWSIGWWISMRDRPWLQLLGMVPVGVVVLFIHGLVFGLWGLMLAAVELGLALQDGRFRLAGLARRWSLLLLLAVIPVLLFLQMRTAGAEGGAIGSVSNLVRIASGGVEISLTERLWQELLKRIDSILRVVESSDPWPDRIFGAVLWLGLAMGLVRRDLRFDRRLLPLAALCFMLIWLMPPNLFGVGHLDERAPLLFLAVVIAGLSVSRSPAGRLVSTLALLFPLHLLLASGGMMQAGQVYRDYLVAVRTVDTGPLAAAAFDEDTAERDLGRQCKPLLFLLQLVNGTAVPTFAHPTQQPLRLAGPLAAATAAAGSTRDRGLDQSIPQLLGAGFSTVVACTDDTPPVISGAVILRQGEGWAIYQSAPTTSGEPD